MIVLMNVFGVYNQRLKVEMNVNRQESQH